MKRLYFSLFLAVVLTLTAGILSINYLASQYLLEGVGDPAVFEALAREFDELAAEFGQQRTEELAAAMATANLYELRLLARQDPSLPPGLALAPEGEKRFHWPLGEDEGWFVFGDLRTIYHVRPLQELQERAAHATLIGNLALLAIIAGMCLWWISGLQRRVAHLERAAKAFSAGEFGTRVPETGRYRLGTLNATFNRMADEIARLIDAHRQLTNAIAHECRTPLFRLQCQLALLEESGVSEVQRPVLGEMQTDIDELDALLRELLFLARMERAGLALEPTTLALPAWLKAVVERLGHEGGRPLTLTFEPMDADLQWHGDARYLERALGNVLRNAHVHARSTIRVTARRQDGRVRVAVEDDGPGIPPAQRERVFEPFTRLDPSRERRSGGHGLGLAIARQILLAHQGGISLGDSALGGACFELWLPDSATPRSELGPS